MKAGTVIFILQNLNTKTLYFNFKHFPFSIACKMPVFISRKVFLKDTSGLINLPQNASAGMIKIGYGDVGIFDKKKSRTIWEVKGSIQFKGNADIGHGSRICVGPAGALIIGQNFKMTAESSIVCFKKILFGNDCLLSWEILLMDTDFHKIYDDNILMNADREIIVGNHVWIGARCTILKGSEIPNGCVIASNALVAGKLLEERALYGGQPAKILKENITWQV